MNLIIRQIKNEDDQELASVIRSSLMEFSAAKPGTVYFDPTTDQLSNLFETPGSYYFVLEQDGQICGGAGIYPTQDLPPSTCELVKLYLSPAARGQGLGRKLMELCESKAVELGYKFIYLETMPELKIAVPLYEKMGYKNLAHPLGNSGHTGCGIWMMKDL